MKAYFEELLRYEMHANRRVLGTLSYLDNVPEKAYRIASHLLAAQCVWLERLTNQPTQTQVRTEWPKESYGELSEEHSRLYRNFLAELTEEDFDKVINYVNSKGEAFTSTVREILTHLQLHSAYHRGQIVTLIRPLLEHPPVTGYISYLREEQAITA